MRSISKTDRARNNRFGAATIGASSGTSLVDIQLREFLVKEVIVNKNPSKYQLELTLTKQRIGKYRKMLRVPAYSIPSIEIPISTKRGEKYAPTISSLVDRMRSRYFFYKTVVLYYENYVYYYIDFLLRRSDTETKNDRALVTPVPSLIKAEIFPHPYPVS